MSSKNHIAVIDIGSNSIKLLVAGTDIAGNILTVYQQAAEARISAGISKDNPRLGEAGITAGVEAVATLCNVAQGYSPKVIALVATSAVRDAHNRDEFCAKIHEATGNNVRILCGEEEARLIGLGVRSDPALRHLQDFNLFDLGGGSLECLSFANGKTVQALSLPLGCVRLTERFVADVKGPYTKSDAEKISTHIRAALRASTFEFGQTGKAAVFAGGSMTTARAIFASTFGLEAKDPSALLSVETISRILEDIALLPLHARRTQVPGLPPSRADVFPAALTTMLTVADYAGIKAYHHTFYNLRYGLAAELFKTNTL